MDIPESIEELPRFVQRLALQIDQQARLPPERLQALKEELEWRLGRWERWSSVLAGSWAQWGLAPGLAVILVSAYAATHGFLGEQALWWVLAGVVALQLCFTAYAMHVRHELERALQLVEFARRQQANSMKETNGS
ncbi:MAG TPA: hypothetical protein VJU61_16850 [Polyangiaceae bacterium]|nr:hypothetical protein [Polyangiaceae bacterium]